MVEFWLPRVVCQSGGSAQISFSILRPYQQIWTVVELQVDCWADLGLYLVEMQRGIAHHSQTQIGLRSLNQMVNRYEPITHTKLSSVPSVVMLDAIWIMLLQPIGDHQQDNLKRTRQVKVRHKVCIRVALSLYPQSQWRGILGWYVVDSENQEGGKPCY